MTDSTTAERTDDHHTGRRVRLLRGVSIVEATSYLLLLVAAAVKRTDGSEIGVEVIGPTHGVLFLIYALLIVKDHRLLDWSMWKALGAIILGSLPFGGYWVERRWIREGSASRPGLREDRRA